jgi:TfoX/Sxy family transcriptional regulator of competence genes
MEGIRNHPWVMRNEKEPPLKIPPRVQGDNAQLSSMISTIYYDNKFTIMTLGKPFKTDSTSFIKVLDKNEKPFKLQARRKSISITPLSIESSATITQDKMRSVSAKPILMEEKQDTFKRMSIVGPDESVEPDLEAIQNWHRLHRPPKYIRTSQLQYGTAESCSMLDPSTMFQDLHNALLRIQSNLPKTLQFFRQPDFYVFLCKYGTGEEQLVFEAEICKAWLSASHSLQIRRVKGDPQLLKEIQSQLVAELDWNKE